MIQFGGWKCTVNDFAEMSFNYLTDDIQITGLGLGGGCVDLAEVSTPVRFLDVIQMQMPGAVILVRYCHQ